ncbi:unnamed protein product [Ectocarpus fasciculatus]
MYTHFVKLSLLVPGVIHLLPLYGVCGRRQLAALYGLKFNEPNTLILMKHRAVLFGLLGGLLTYATFEPKYRDLAFLAGLASASSFLAFACLDGGYNDKLRGVVVADVVALASLIGGSAVHFLADV